MKASELRIGNRIGLNLAEFPENYFTVLEVADISMKVSDGSDNHFFAAEDMEGIPITAEWLKRFGAYGSYNYSFSCTSRNFALTIELPVSGSSRGLCNASVTWDYTGRWLTTIQYVHQLQNLYYALTSTELTPKD